MSQGGMANSERWLWIAVIVVAVGLLFLGTSKGGFMPNEELIVRVHHDVPWMNWVGFLLMVIGGAYLLLRLIRCIASELRR